MQGPASRRRAALVDALALGVWAGPLVALAVAAIRYREVLAAGFGRVFARQLVAAGGVGLAAGAAAGLAFWGLYRLGRRRWGPRLAAGVATALVAAPFGLALALSFNRARGIHPRDLGAAWALVPNLGLLAAFAVAVAAVALALGSWARRNLESGAPGRLGRWLAVGAVSGLGLLALAARASTVPRGTARPPVFVLLVDALRADHLSSAGYPRETTPHLDALAADGVQFTAAVAASTFTKSSIASLFTGRFPYQHGVYWGNRRDAADRLTSDVLPSGETTLAEALAERGYLTLGLVQNSHLRPWMGFAQGFVHYRDQQGGIRRIHRVLGRWLPWIADQPFFAYLHYIDLHDPYRPDPPWDGRFGPPRDVYAGIDLRQWGTYLADVAAGRITPSAEQLAGFRDLYDGQLAFVDAEIGQLLGRLRRAGLYDRSLVVVTSDHGDAFGEHGFISHSAAPYEELVRVPLVVKLPGNRFAGRRVEAQVRSVDLLPTILDVVGASPRGPWEGCSLLPLLRGNRGAGQDPSCGVAVIEIAEEEGQAPTLALRTAGWKYIRRAGREELYDLAADPGELRDLASDEAALAPLRRLADEVEARRRERDAAGTVPLDPQTVRELEALGYL